MSVAPGTSSAAAPTATSSATGSSTASARGDGAGRSGGRPQLGAVLRRDRRFGRVDRGRRDLLSQPRRPAHRVPVSDRRGSHVRSSPIGSPVLLCPRRPGRTSSRSPSPATRSGPSGTRWPAIRGSSSSGHRMRSRGQRGDLGGRIRIRSAPGRVARLLHERFGAGLDPAADAGHLHRRRDASVPGVAARRPAARRRGVSAAASTSPTSRITTSRRGSSGTATWSSTTTISSGEKRSNGWRATTIGGR